MAIKSDEQGIYVVAKRANRIRYKGTPNFVPVGDEVQLRHKVAHAAVRRGDAEYASPDAKPKARPKPGPAETKPAGSDEVKATAKAAELAEASGLDLGSIEGTGKDGKVTLADVEAAIDG